MEVTPIRYFEDNFCYLIRGSPTSPFIVVDPGDTEGLLPRFSGLQISHVLFTHRHWDHVGDIPKLLQGLKSQGQDPQVFIGSKEGVPLATRQLCGEADEELIDLEHLR